MDLPKVIIKENYNDFINGKEVEATVALAGSRLAEGMHVMGYHDSIAAKTAIAVPREKQAQYIGVEGIITAISPRTAEAQHRQRVRIVKA